MCRSALAKLQKRLHFGSLESLVGTSASTLACLFVAEAFALLSNEGCLRAGEMAAGGENRTRHNSGSVAPTASRQERGGEKERSGSSRLDTFARLQQVGRCPGHTYSVVPPYAAARAEHRSWTRTHAPCERSPRHASRSPRAASMAFNNRPITCARLSVDAVVALVVSLLGLLYDEGCVQSGFRSASRADPLQPLHSHTCVSPSQGLRRPVKASASWRLGCVTVRRSPISPR